MIRIRIVLVSAFLLLISFHHAFGQSITLPLNPDVEAMIAAVSADTIFANLDRLVSFHTRHTTSDTVSEVSGIGAARRFIYRQFQNYASDPMTVELQPSYFTFDQTVCGIAGEHRNVLATLAGASAPDRFFIVMGHIDSRNEDNCDAVGYAAGANDDCSGTAVAMEMARTMSKFGMEATVILMPVTGEEQGLLGSDAYAEFAMQQGMQVDAAITNDIVGNIQGCADPDCPPGEPVITDSMSVRHFSGDPATGPSRQLARYMKIQAARYFPEFTVNLIPLLDRPGRGGDHISFYDRGFASARFTEANEAGVGDGSSGRQHNMLDTISAVNTNRGYMASVAKVNIAGIASLALAPASPQGLAAFDVGDGGSVQLAWPPGQTEGDFAGYMLARRHPDSLFYVEFYDAGLSNQYIVSGLVPGEEVHFSLAAYDSAGNLSLFSEEVSISPMTLPRPPGNPDAISAFTDVHITWDPNTELDVVRYRIYRGLSRTSGFVLYDSVAVPGVEYHDAGMAVHTMYFYQIRSVDSDGNESMASEAVAGQLVTHDLGVLVVDATRDGTGSPLTPTDEMVDDQYLALLRHVTVGAHYDLADTSALGYRLFDADLAPYSTVIWHTDVRGSSPLYQDTLAIMRYLLHGGNLIIGGWRLSASLKAGATLGVTVYPAGTFTPTYLKVDSTLTSGALTQDFMTAVGVLPGYQDVSVDIGRIPLYNGTLVNTDVALPPFSGGAAEAVYTHHGMIGSGLEGKPVGWRSIGAIYGLVVFDFPLYYMEEEAARSALEQAFTDLGEPVSVKEGEAGSLPVDFRLHQNYPNPFNPSTEIRFDMPVKGRARLIIFDMLGRQVKVLLDDERSPGVHKTEWDGKGGGGRPIASGVYYYEIVIEPADPGRGRFRDVKAMVVLK
jgi:hypothetical protein